MSNYKNKDIKIGCDKLEYLSAFLENMTNASVKPTQNSRNVSSKKQNGVLSLREDKIMTFEVNKPGTS